MFRGGKILAIALLLAMPKGSFAFDLGACRRVARAAAEDPAHPLYLASETQKQFVDAMMQVTGRRTLESAPDVFRGMHVAGDEMSWPGYEGGLNARVIFTNESSPRIRTSRNDRTLYVPRDFTGMTPQRFRSVIQRWLLGHPLHPFIKDNVARAERESLGENSLLLKRVQGEAMVVSDHYLEAFHEGGDASKQRLLIAAPTGTGKTEIVKANLLKAMELAPHGVHIVVADQVGLVGQLHRDLEPMTGPNGFALHAWGAEEVKGGPRTIAALEAEARTSGKPIVLVTTIQSLMSQLGARRVGEKADPEALASLRRVLRHFVYDEVHHGSGELRSDIIRDLLDENPHASATGITATPTEGAVDIFGNRAFYTYLDKPEGHISEAKPAIRDVGDAVKQLQLAFRAGELVPFGKLKMISPRIAGGNDVFVMEKTGEAVRAVVNREYYPHIFKAIESAALNKQGIIVANTEAEAIRLRDAFQQIFGSHGRVAEVVTYNTVTNSKEFQEVKDRFNSGKTHVLISVQKLDEGIDLPNASYYVDLNRNIRSREFLQRLGRTTRVAPRKTHSEVFVLTPKTREEVVMGLKMKGRKRRPGSGEGNGSENFDGLEIHLTGEEPVERENGITLDENLPIVAWDAKLVFDHLRATNVETFDFWEPPRKELTFLSENDQTLFTAPDGMLRALIDRFKGASKRIGVVIDALAEGLPEGQQAAFRERHGNLGNDRVLYTAESARQASARVVGLLSDYATIQHGAGNLEEPVSQADLLRGATLTKLLGDNKRIVIDVNQHGRFHADDGMFPYLKARFPGVTQGSERFVAQLAELLPEAEREAFRQRHAAASKQLFVNAVQHEGPSAAIIQIVADWAGVKVQHGELANKPTTEELLTATTGGRLFGERFVPKLKLGKSEHAAVLSEDGLVPYLKDRFPGVASNSRRLVSDLAALLPEAERESFIIRHDNLGNDAIVSGATKMPGNAGRLVELVEDWAKIRVKRGELAAAPTQAELLTRQTATALFGDRFHYGLELSTAQFDSFRSEAGMLTYVIKKFGRNELKEQLAARLPEPEREAFLTRHTNFSPSAIKDAPRTKGSAATIVGILGDWAKVQKKLGKLAEVPSTESLLLGATGSLLFGEN